MQQPTDNKRKLPVTGNDAVLSLLDAVRRGETVTSDKPQAMADTPQSVPQAPDMDKPAAQVDAAPTAAAPENAAGEKPTSTEAAEPAERDKTDTNESSDKDISSDDMPDTDIVPAVSLPTSQQVSDQSEAETVQQAAESDQSSTVCDEPTQPEMATAEGEEADGLAAATPPRWMRWLPRLVAALLCTAALFAPIAWSYYQGNLYYVYDDNGEYLGLTHSREGARVAYERFDDLYDEDTVSVQTLGATGFVSPVRSFPVSVTADGKTQEFRILEGTAGDLLRMADLSLRQHDLCSHEADDVLTSGEEVVIQRVTYRDHTILDDVIEWQEVTKPSPLLREGVTRAMDEGEMRNGVGDRVYREKYIDGELVESVLVSEDISKYPWNAVTLVGDPNAVLSTVNGADFTDVQIVDGVPESYQYVINSGVCTAYSFNPGVWGAAGTYLFQGFVAVDPDEIPLGSLLYVTRRDGSFVYGWAIAADIGEAMVDGRVDIDCFMETYDESVLFGRRIMDIYVVEQLTQDDLEQFVANPGMFRNRIPEADEAE